MAKNLGGRPKKEIDQHSFEEMCKIQCTKDEICNILACDEKTLTRWCHDTYNCGFSDIHKTFADNGRMSLRRYQFNLAKTNTAMAIWLGKQYLGQSDRIITSIINENEPDPITQSILNSVEK